MKKLKCVLQLLYKYGFNSGTIKSIISILFGRNKYIRICLKEYKYPFLLRRKGSDLDVFYEIILKFEYKLERDIKPKTILDCGANIGLASIYFKSQYPDSHIIAIEPAEGNYDLMVKNLSEYTDIEYLKTGIWNKHTHLIVSNPEGKDYGFVFEEVRKTCPDSIESFSIKDIMEKYSLDSIDILKIDIEGSEKEVFESDYDYWLSRTKVIIIELHDNTRKGCSKSFFNALQQYNFSTEINGENFICYLKD